MPPPAVAVDPVVHPDGGGVGPAVLPGEALDLGDGEAGGLGRPLRRPLEGPLPELGGAHGVALEVVMVLEAVAEDDVHHPEGQGGVGARKGRKVLVRLLRGARAEGVHGDEAGAPAARLLDEGPLVDVGADDVGAPGHDEASGGDGLGVVTQAPPHRGFEAPGPGGGADGPVQEARAEGLEEATVHAAVAEDAKIAGVGVGQDRLGTVGVRHRPEPFGDLVEGLLPGDALETALALPAHALQGVQDALGAVDPLQVAVHLGAEEAPGEGVLGVPPEGHRPALPRRRRS